MADIGQDISGELAGEIADGQVFGNSDNIRVGRYRFLVKRVFAEKMDSGRFAFALCHVISAGNNPQTLPPGVSEKQFDLGLNPNRVGSDCAMKVNFDGNGAKSAPGNVKAFVLGLFGKNQADTSKADVDNTWRDLARRKDLKAGDPLGVDTATNQVIYAKEAKRANPACGMVVDCIASMKEKKKTKLLPPEQKEYVTILTWECASKPGTGENTHELIAKRRAEIEANLLDDDVDDETAVAASSPAPAAVTSATAPSSAAPFLPGVVPPPPVAIAPPVSAAFPPPPWRPHPDQPMGTTPDTRWYWDGATSVKNEAQLRAGQ